MRSENISLDTIKFYMLNQLSQIYLWSERLDKYFVDEKKTLGNKIKRRSRINAVVFPDIKKIFGDNNRITPEMLYELKKNKPEDFEVINRYAKVILTMETDQTLLSLAENVFPNIAWSSLFLITISYVEYFLGFIIENLSKKNKIKLRLRDLSGNSSYEKFKNYCNKVLNIKYKFNSAPFWEKIICHKDVRNLVIHNKGYIDDEKKLNKIKSFISKGNTSLTLDNNTIIIDKDYLNEVIFDIEDWLVDFFPFIEGD